MKGQCTSVILDQNMISSWHQKLWQIEHIVRPRQGILLSLANNYFKFHSSSVWYLFIKYIALSRLFLFIEIGVMSMLQKPCYTK